MKDATILYACVLEAQSAGDRRQTINALEKVLDKYDYSAPEGVHLPALLRYARMHYCTTYLIDTDVRLGHSHQSLSRMVNSAQM